MSKITCYIVDYEKSDRDRIIDVLKKFNIIDIIGSTGVPEKAISSILKNKPDVVFIDVEMPGYTGFDILHEIRRQNVFPKFIFVTAYKHYAIKALRENAFDYLLKPIDIDEVSETLRRLRYHTRIYKNGESSQNPLSKFTKRELDIMKLIVACKTTREIADELNISKNTVETHRKKIYKKLGIHKSSELIAFSINIGLIKETN